MILPPLVHPKMLVMFKKSNFFLWEHHLIHGHLKMYKFSKLSSLI